MDATLLHTEIFPQSLDSVYESSDDYDELLFFLLVGQNSSSSLTSKTSGTMLKGAAEPGSLQLKLDSLHICQDSHQNQQHKDQANDSSRSSAQSTHTSAFSTLEARNEDPQVAMFQDFFQIPMLCALYPVQFKFQDGDRRG
jgi:hypothetical protein